MATKKIRPFARQGHFTAFDNYAVDYIMPRVKPSAWKVFCYIIRKTVGWQKDEDAISYRAIMKGTGIKSSTTVSASLQELLDASYINIVSPANPDNPKSFWEANTYSLNLDFEDEIEDGRGDTATSKNDVGTKGKSTSKNDVAPTSKNGDIKKKDVRKKEKESRDAGASSARQLTLIDMVEDEIEDGRGDTATLDTTALTPESGDMQEDAEQKHCEHILDATPKQDAISKRVASKGKQKVAKADKQQKERDETLDAPQVQVWREEFSCYPNETQRPLLVKYAPDCDRLRDACKAFKTTSRNKTNVPAVLDLYDQQMTPDKMVQRAKSGGRYAHRNDGNSTHPPQSTSVAPDGSINIIGSGVLKRVSSYS